MLEICVEDLAGVEAALAGGADRLEVCSALALGGLTPSAALVAHAARSGVPVRALVRPRAGGFRYDAQELALMQADIAAMLDAGAEGLVLGAADGEGELDEAAVRGLVRAARERGGPGVGLTLHRMVDLTRDPAASVTRAAALGFDAVLSSGGARRALDGAGTLARMVAAAPHGLTVMAGAGVTPRSAPALMRRSGVRALHASAKGRPTPTPAPLVALGFAACEQATTSAKVVGRLKAVLEARSPGPESRAATGRAIGDAARRRD